MGVSVPESGPMTTDEWDAVISAWATYQGLCGCWKHDLMDKSRDAMFPAAARPTYYWPV
jgi:hypothetical protein